jgi:N-acetylglucosamine kinase-like BadF-type ATPase
MIGSVLKEFFLGVDGGQSSTLALIGDSEGRVLGRGIAGPCNHAGAIGSSINNACVQAGLQAAPEFTSACLGLSGGPQDKEALMREGLRAAKLTVTNDALIALYGALAGEPGAVTIAGTGSIAYARNRAGKVARAGGWGSIFGDEGGGFDIARRALRTALRFEEGWGPPTTLHATLLSKCKATTANELMHRFYTPEFPKSEIASLAVLVDQAAEAGDHEAVRILREAAESLAKIANAVCLQLFGKEDVPVAYVGGVFKSRILLDQFHKSAENRVVAPIHGPAVGALLEAYSAAGRTVFLANVAQALACAEKIKRTS